MQIDDAKVLIDPYIDSSNVENPEPFIEFYYQEDGEYQKASKSKYSQIIHSFDVFIRLKNIIWNSLNDLKKSTVFLVL